MSNLQVGGIVVGFLIQFAGLVWGAAMLKSAVDSLKDSIKELSSSVQYLDSRVDDHEVRVSVLEHRT